MILAMGSHNVHTHTLNVVSYNKYWPEDGLVKAKHGAKTMYY